jgi:hypothetical protein
VAKKERVEVSADLTAKARGLYPKVSAEGRPTLTLFERGPLAAAGEYFGRYFDVALVESEGSPVRYYQTVSTFFPVLGFFAIRVADHVEIIDFIVDDDYWGVIEGDPEG